MGVFPDAQGQLTPQSEVEPGRNSNSSKIIIIVVLVIPKNEEDQIKNEDARVATFFPIITQWKLYVAMETRVLI